MKAILTAGLGFGDEGKGATVDFLCRKYNADLVVKYCGGPQCGHRVELADGRSHIFSQFGAGTLAGVKTYIGPDVIISPIGISKEAEKLKEFIDNPYQFLTIDSECLICTPFHAALNRIKEIVKTNGSCGVGVGETRKYYLDYGSDSIIAADLCCPNVVYDKLKLIRERFKQQVQRYINGIKQHGKLDIDKARPSLDIIFYTDLYKLTEDICDIGIYDIFSFEDKIPEFTTAIFEGAQGILLDEWRGFHPHTTWSNLSFDNAFDLFEREKERFLGMDVCKLGITRAYHTRHGAGPFAQEPKWKFEDKCNSENAWQGKIKFGPLNLTLLRYALQVLQPDCIAVNCLDHLSTLTDVLVLNSPINVIPDEFPSLENQKKLSKLLFSPVDFKHFTKTCISDLLFAIKSSLKYADGFSVPVVIHGNGPTAENRTLEKELVFKKL